MVSKKAAVLAFVGMVLMMAGCSVKSVGKTSGEPQSISVFAMDTYMTLTVYDGEQEKALAEAKAEIERLEGLWSVTDENSEIYRLDNSTGTAQVSDETARLIDAALDMNTMTNGALDISLYPVLAEWGFTNGNYKIPDEKRLSQLLGNVDCQRIKVTGNTVEMPEGMKIDLGSLGKGETGDRVTEIFKENGVGSALLDLGGNIQVIGSKPDGSPWKVGIKDPWGEGSLAKVEVTDCCVITSGGYERYFEGDDGEIYWHILDPETGRPAHSGILSTTVIGDRGRLCDGLSTALFVMGEEKAEELWRTVGGFDMILITEDNRLIMTEGLTDKVSVYPQYGDIVTEVIEDKT